jgi:polyphosphate kinase
VVTPVEAPELREKLRQILDVQLTNQRSTWDMQPDGTYIQRLPGEDQDARGAQEILIALAEQRQKVAQRLKKRKRKGEISSHWNH